MLPRLAAITLVVMLALSFACGDDDGGSPTPTGTGPSAGPETETTTPTDTPTPTPEPFPAACSGPPDGRTAPEADGDGYQLARVLPDADFENMIDIVPFPGTDDREAILITQNGRLYRICVDGPGEVHDFGDIRSFVECCGESGLLSIAFSPDFAADGSGLVYLYYTRRDSGGDTDRCSGDAENQRCSYLSRFRVTDAEMDPEPVNNVLEIDQPDGNHNGGTIRFGDEEPVPYIYLSLGDGGGFNDTYSNGQNWDTLLGTIVRLDVVGQETYAVPPDNPFVGTDGADEIWAWGLRNPWRMSFDRQTGDLWVVDVGQAQWEEVNVVVKGGNYGWVCFEGPVEYDINAVNCPPRGNLQAPRAWYENGSGSETRDCAIAGGYVYRGEAIPELTGHFVMGDYCSGRVRSYDTATDDPPELLIDSDERFLSVNELPNGEIIFLALSGIYQLVHN